MDTVKVPEPSQVWSPQGPAQGWSSPPPAYSESPPVVTQVVHLPGPSWGDQPVTTVCTACQAHVSPHYLYIICDNL